MKNMKNLTAFLNLICLLLLAGACSQKDPIASKGIAWVYGKNTYDLEFGEQLRNFVVHVPDTYNEGEPVPLLFMLHGASGNGDQFYRISRWVEKADEENFIVVFPTGVEYVMASSGNISTRWSSDGLAKDLEPGTPIVDDVPFFYELVELLSETFSIDASRMYICGFSNGGGFIRSRVIPEMGDLFTAAATCGGVGLTESEAVAANYLMPLFAMLGTKDEAIIQSIGVMEELPIAGADFMAHPLLREQVDGMLETLRLDSLYQEIPNQPAFNLLRFEEDLSGQGNEYNILLVKDAKHVFPNGGNNPSQVVAADELWPWFATHKR